MLHHPQRDSRHNRKIFRHADVQLMYHIFRSFWTGLAGGADSLLHRDPAPLFELAFPKRYDNIPGRMLNGYSQPLPRGGWRCNSDYAFLSSHALGALPSLPRRSHSGLHPGDRPPGRSRPAGPPLLELFPERRKYTPRAGGSSGNRQQSGQNRTYEYQAGYQSRRKPSRDPYRILHIDRSATPEAIKRAYREQAARYHPDKVAHLGEEFQAMAKEKFQDIQWAYEQLTGKHHA